MKRASLKTAILIPSISILLVGIVAMVIVVGAVASASTNDITARLIDARVNEYSNKFETLSLEAYSTVRTLAPIINERAINSENPRDEILGVLESVLMSDDNLLAVWTCWEPNALDGKDGEYAGAQYHDETGRYVPYVYREGTGYGVEPLVDYTVPGTGDFYLGARDSGKPYITDPYPYDIGGKSVPIYSISIPIMRDNAVVGVVGIDINLANLVSTMNQGHILNDGYIFVLSPAGLVATHSSESLLLNSYKTTWMKNYAAEVESLFVNGGNFNMTAYSDVTNTYMNFLAHGVKIGNTERYWAVCGVVPQDTVTAASKSIVTLVVAIGAALIVVTGLAIFLLIRNSLKKMPAITAMAGRIALGDISAMNLDSDAKPTKNEIALLERAFRAIADSIKVQSDIMASIAHGDYSMTVPVRSDGDIMNKAINEMIDKTNDTLSQINESAVQVSTGSHQVADGAQALAAGSTEQAASVQQLSSSIAEVAERTKDNSLKAEQAAKLAITIKDSAEKGSEQMNDMIESVKNINEASQSIGKVIKTIEDIAFQTNILALNAAVEAARAGQHGKGFAVVAEEVRNLSAKSAQAAKDTESLIEDSMQKAEHGVKVAGETAASLSEIVTGINESSALVTEIARASEEQSISISQINVGVDQVAKVVQQNSATAQESAAASEEMSSQSALLRELIAPFKLKNDSSPQRIGAQRAAKRIAAPKNDSEYAGYGDEYGKY